MKDWSGQQGGAGAPAEGLPSGKARTGHWEGREEAGQEAQLGWWILLPQENMGPRGGQEWGRSMRSEGTILWTLEQVGRGTGHVLSNYT